MAHVTEFQPTPDGLSEAIDQALVQHAEHIAPVENRKQVVRGVDDGIADELTLYPDPDNPQESLRIRALGEPGERNLEPGANVHLRYVLGGMSVYAVFGPQGKRQARELTGGNDHDGTPINREADIIAISALQLALVNGQPQKPKPDEGPVASFLRNKLGWS